MEAKSEKNGDRPCIVSQGGQVTYRQLDLKSNQVSNSLLEQGIRPDERVAVMLPNCPEFLILWIGLAKLGSVTVPLNVHLRGDLLGYMLAHSESKAIVVDSSYLPVLRELDPKLVPPLVIVRGDSGISPKTNREVPLGDLLANSSTKPVERTLDDLDLMELFYTSGTTGPSKGVMRSHGSAIADAASMVRRGRYTSNDVIYTCLPLYHGNAQLLSFLPAVLADASFALGERFSASRFWKEVTAFGATEFNYVGSMLTILHKQEPSERDTLHKVRFAIGAAAPADIWRAFEQRFNLRIIEIYGMVETGISIHNLDGRVGSMGKPTELYEARIVDERGNELPQTSVGEVVLRPKVPNVLMEGYYKMPTETLNAFRNLWFHTGDLAYRDGDDCFYFVDRKKDAIRRRGENISSFEVEKIVNQHPKVLECAAVGVPSEVGEEEIKICIVLKESQVLAPEELISFCEEKMPYYMVPRYVEFRTSFPRTPTERVEKYKLKSEGIKNETWDREKAGYKLRRKL